MNRTKARQDLCATGQPSRDASTACAPHGRTVNSHGFQRMETDTTVPPDPEGVAHSSFPLHEPPLIEFHTGFREQGP